MATKKIDFSLRLRHEFDSLSNITEQLGFVADAGWDKGDQNRTVGGSLREGTRESSYRSFALGNVTGTEMEEALPRYLHKVAPFGSSLRSFVNSGGIASFAVSWFCENGVGGERISMEVLAEMARLSLTLDLYMYVSPEELGTVVSNKDT